MMFRKKKQKPVLDFTDLLSADVEHTIVLQQALLASLKIITFQKEAWADLKELLEEKGVSVMANSEAQQQYKDLHAPLRASMVVLAELTDFPKDEIEQIGSDEL